jgi:hypothetical protein
MTCDEFKALVGNDPRKATIAERAGAVRHSRDCPACMGWFKSEYEKEDREFTAKYGPGPNAIIDLIASVEGAAMSLEIYNDPEARAVAEGE